MNEYIDVMNVNEASSTVNQTLVKADDPLLVLLEKRLSAMILLRFMIGVILFWFSSGLDQYGWARFSKVVAFIGIAMATWGIVWLLWLMRDKRRLATQSGLTWQQIPAFAAMRRRCGW